MTTRISPVCTKCVVIKRSGRLSCCAPGGAWFENCGTSSNSNTDHTWVEGIQACRDVVSLFSGKAEAQSIISVNQTTTTQPLKDIEHQVIDSILTVACDISSKDNEQISDVTIFTSVLLIMFLNIQTWSYTYYYIDV